MDPGSGAVQAADEREDNEDQGTGEDHRVSESLGSVRMLEARRIL